MILLTHMQLKRLRQLWHFGSGWRSGRRTPHLCLDKRQLHIQRHIYEEFANFLQYKLTEDCQGGIEGWEKSGWNSPEPEPFWSLLLRFGH